VGAVLVMSTVVEILKMESIMRSKNLKTNFHQKNKRLTKGKYKFYKDFLKLTLKHNF
jgi:hypothetical protein